MRATFLCQSVVEEKNYKMSYQVLPKKKVVIPEVSLKMEEFVVLNINFYSAMQSSWDKWFGKLHTHPKSTR